MACFHSVTTLLPGRKHGGGRKSWKNGEGEEKLSAESFSSPSPMPLCPQISSLALRVGFGPFHIIVTALDIAHDDDGEVHDLHRRQRFRAELGIGQHRIRTDAAGQQRPSAAGGREIDRPGNAAWRP